MNGHLDPVTLQDLLDGELAPAERLTAEAHLATCEACAAELAVFRRVFGGLEALPTWDPGPAFTDRVMAAVLPELPVAAVRPAWWGRLAWGYGAAVAASVAGLAVAVVTPAGREALHDLAFAAVRALVSSTLFVFTSINDGVLRLADSGRLLASASGRLSPFGRAVVELVQQPMVFATILAAVATCAALLWWMRPRERRSWRGMQDVGLLGL